MEMIYCPNCAKHTGFKRAFGFGTLFAVLITAGLWLLVLPFYPARCITCGLTRTTAFWENLRTNPRKAVTGSSLAAAIVIVLIAIVWFANRAPERITAVTIENRQSLFRWSRSCSLKQKWEVDFAGNGRPYLLEQRHCGVAQLSTIELSKSIGGELAEGLNMPPANGRWYADQGYDFLLVIKPNSPPPDEVIHGEMEEGEYSAIEPMELQGRESVVVDGANWGSGGYSHWCLLAEGTTGAISCWTEQKGDLDKYLHKNGYLRPDEIAKSWHPDTTDGQLFMSAEVAAQGDPNCCPSRGKIQVTLTPTDGVLHWDSVTRSTSDGLAQQSADTITDHALLDAYQKDEKAAESKYKDRRLIVTGALTGIFVPPPERTLEMAKKGVTATPFVTMGGPAVGSPAESLLLPGIVAHSEEGSFWGQPESIPLRIAQTVTLNCKCDRGSPAIAQVPGTGPKYSIVLSDCKMDATSPLESQTSQESGVAASEGQQ